MGRISSAASRGNKPFVTTTVSTGVGAFEFWLQKMPIGGQVQLWYQLMWH